MDYERAFRYASTIARSYKVPYGLHDDLVQEGLIEWMTDPDAPALGKRMRWRMVDWMRTWFGRKDCSQWVARHVPLERNGDDEALGPAPIDVLKAATDVEAVVVVREELHTLLQGINDLTGPERDAMLIGLHDLGCGDGEKPTLREIGARYGVTESMACLYRQHAREKLATQLEARPAGSADAPDGRRPAVRACGPTPGDVAAGRRPDARRSARRCRTGAAAARPVPAR